MFGASSLVRFAAALCACALAVSFATLAPAQTINLSLDVFYSNPANSGSGGTWELVAKSSDFGISGLRTRLTNINSLSPTIEQKAPRGTFNNGNLAGFGIFYDVDQTTYHEFTIGQIPQPDGSPQGAFYGVGTLTNGSPTFPGQQAGTNSIGPPIPTLTNTQDIPWAVADAFNDPTWSTAARFASGTFAAGVTPAFMSGSNGNIFTALGTSTSYGTDVQATTVSTIVRTNLAQSADYNHNGSVDAADYILWRKTLNASVPNGTGADGNGDGTINLADYNLWRSHFGSASGAGASLSSSSVPEPATCTLFTIAAMLAFARHRHRAKGIVNN